MKYLILVLILMPSLVFAEQGQCPEQTRKDYKEVFLECLQRMKVNSLQGAKYQGWDDVVSECHDAAQKISGIIRNGYFQCYIQPPVKEK